MPKALRPQPRDRALRQWVAILVERLTEGANGNAEFHGEGKRQKRGSWVESGHSTRSVKKQYEAGDPR